MMSRLWQPKSLIRALHSSCTRHTLHPFLETASSGSVAHAITYSQQISEQEPEPFRLVREQAISFDAHEARKMISPLQGSFMAQMVRAARAENVLELGCYLGYSALWLAHGLGNDKGHVWTCERDMRVADHAAKHVAQAGLLQRISVVPEPADKVLRDWDLADRRLLDFIFIDANKSGYRGYYDLIMDRGLLSQGGLIVVDNVLFHGQVPQVALGKQMADEGKGLRIAKKLLDFNQHVAQDSRTVQTLLPVFDGLLLVRRA
ncbi:S-adenosyl-L-methionine-dependent methyltransferase [Linderina pennispora]|uniref:S-adenosyl-L-methionine-dependent methyltransferase n=1 Tax=Linderina pennispora TaxID=61395 RepID=A0A1Y1VVU9_9FUNG|nr:S-adenosyl-L-methionine-dependent methyltransferase [Linderina pennispora]ORX65418.1 S-adenosyl-L-methionine-dependent methyltransferase [Linderina pennispora]